MIPELFQRIWKGAIPVRDDESAVEQAKQALDDAKARRRDIDATDPRRLADAEITQRQAELTQAERDALMAHYRQLQARGEALVTEYQHVAGEFDAKLADLVASLSHMSRLTASIVEIRDELWQLSRPLGLTDIGVAFRPKEWFAQVTGSLQRAWRTGQHT
jgi:hypothetical protein